MSKYYKISEGAKGVRVSFTIMKPDKKIPWPLDQAKLLMYGGNEYNEIEKDMALVGGGAGGECYYDLTTDETDKPGHYGLKVWFKSGSVEQTTTTYGELDILEVD